MASGDHTHFDDAPGSLARLRALLLKWPDVGAALRMPRRIDRRWPIVYLAGISTDGRTVYIDEHLPDSIDGIPLDKYLEVHEATEYAIWRVAAADARLKKFLGQGNLYELCHHLATAAEQYAVVSDGYRWQTYRKGLEPYFAPIEKEKPSRCPPDLALYPYSGALRQALEKAQQKSRLAKDEANYLEVAPTGRTCARCAMFMPRTGRCDWVEGAISPDGSCDKFIPKGD